MEDEEESPGVELGGVGVGLVGRAMVTSVLSPGMAIEPERLGGAQALEAVHPEFDAIHRRIEK